MTRRLATAAGQAAFVIVVGAGMLAIPYTLWALAMAAYLSRISPDGAMAVALALSLLLFTPARRRRAD